MSRARPARRASCSQSHNKGKARPAARRPEQRGRGWWREGSLAPRRPGAGPSAGRVHPGSICWWTGWGGVPQKPLSPQLRGQAQSQGCARTEGGGMSLGPRGLAWKASHGVRTVTWAFCVAGLFSRWRWRTRAVGVTPASAPAGPTTGTRSPSVGLMCKQGPSRPSQPRPAVEGTLTWLCCARLQGLRAAPLPGLPEVLSDSEETVLGQTGGGQTAGIQSGGSALGPGLCSLRPWPLVLRPLSGLWKEQTAHGTPETCLRRAWPTVLPSDSHCARLSRQL